MMHDFDLMERAFCVLLILLTSLSAAKDGKCQSLEIENTGCTDLDKKEVARLILIELANTTNLAPGQLALTVKISCALQSVNIQITNRDTAEVLERTIAPPESPTEERVIALTTSQLIIISWLEKSLAARESAREKNKKDDSSETQKSEPKAANAPEKQISRSKQSDDVQKSHLELSLGGSIEWMVDSKTPLGGVGLRGDLWTHPSFGAVAIVSFDAGSVNRNIGSVTITNTMGGLGVAWRSPVRTRLCIEVHSSGLVGYVYLKGNPKGGNTGGAGGGITGQVDLGLSPTLIVGRVVAAVDLQGGYNFGSPVGRVTGESPVSIGGFRAGVNLRFGFSTDLSRD